MDNISNNKKSRTLVQYERRKEALRSKRDELEDLFYNHFLSIKSIADKMGYSYELTRDILREFGFVRDNKEIQKAIIKSKIKSGSVKEFPVSDEELIDMYLNRRMLIREISESIGINEKIVSYRLLNILNVRKTKEQLNEDLKSYFNRKDENGVTNRQKIREKTVKTCLKKYGKDYPGSDDINNRRKETCIKKYGADNPFKNKDIQEKAKKIQQERYGQNFSQYLMPEKAKYVFSSKDNFIEYLNSFNEINSVSIAKDLSVSYSTVYAYFTKYDLLSMITPSASSIEKEIKDYLNSIGVSTVKKHNILCGKEIDLYSKKHKIGIEVNGNWWHCDMARKMYRSYHLEKSQIAESLGIRLIHIWEYEWNNPIQRDKIKSLLKIAFGAVESRIYARNCNIKEITNSEAKPFNDANHLQNHRNAQKTYGLFYNGKLVQLMSFSYNKKNDWWEIIRGCPGSNNIVVGGVSKLFKHFLKEVNPNKVFSYCDFNKFDGKGYEAIGMKFVGYTGPDMLWLMKNGDVVNRQPSKHKYFVENSKAKIWRAGSKKYLWQKE